VQLPTKAAVHTQCLPTRSYPAYSTTATPASNLGSYAIVPTLSDGGSGKLANYTVTSTNGTLTVTPAPLTVTAANAARLYGAANPTFAGAIVGIQNGDNITASYSTLATAASPVGGYSITVSLSDPTYKLGNYTVTINNGTLTVTPANVSREFNTPDPALTGTITGIQNGDHITANYGTTATLTSPVGTYPITATLNDPTNKLGNYRVTLKQGTLTITPAASSFVVSGFPSPITAGVAGSVLVTAKNAAGQTVIGYRGRIHFTSSDPKAVLPADYTFTAADKGAHAFVITLKKAGTQSLTARDTLLPNATGTQTGIVVKAAAARKFVVAGYPSPTVAGAAHTFTVTAKDAFGNTATGYRGTVHFTSSDAKAAWPARSRSAPRTRRRAPSRARRPVSRSPAARSPRPATGTPTGPRVLVACSWGQKNRTPASVLSRCALHHSVSSPRMAQKQQATGPELCFAAAANSCRGGP
jgi:hypothetical protein